MEEVRKNKDWICTLERMKLANRRAVYMHALPADRGREVVDEVIDGPQSIVIDEAENRLHTAKAIMALTMAEDREFRPRPGKRYDLRRKQCLSCQSLCFRRGNRGDICNPEQFPGTRDP
jgi:hypothetical protein